MTNRTRAERLAVHTPGPWVADDFCMQDDAVVRVGTTDGTPTYYHRSKTICECWIREDEDDDDSPHLLQAEANARLIAAAPDLLRIAKAHLNCCPTCAGSRVAALFDENGNLGSSGPCPSCSEMVAVIAKAEGR